MIIGLITENQIKLLCILGEVQSFLVLVPMIKISNLKLPYNLMINKAVFHSIRHGGQLERKQK